MSGYTIPNVVSQHPRGDRIMDVYSQLLTERVVYLGTGIDAGVEMLGRRGEDQRFDESRPAARRRRDIDEAMDDRAEGEARADVARRIDVHRRPSGPISYEVGSDDDPDRPESDV